MHRSWLFLLVVLSASSANAQAVRERVETHREIVVVRRHTAAPWVVFGVGWALFVGGFFTEILSQPMTGNSCSQCPPSPPTDSALAGQIAGWMGVGTGMAMVIGGLAWHIAEPTGPQVTIVPTVSRGGSGLTLRATF